MTLDTTTSHQPIYYRYPHDHIDIRTALFPTLVLEDELGHNLQTIASSTLAPQGQDPNRASQFVSVNIPTFDAVQQLAPDTFVTIQRPPYILPEIVAVVFALFVATFIVPLFKPEISVQLVVALSIGVLGLRAIIVPSDSPSLIAVDIIILGEYGLILLSLGISGILRWLGEEPAVRKHGLEISLGILVMVVIIAFAFSQSWTNGAGSSQTRCTTKELSGTKIYVSANCVVVGDISADGKALFDGDASKGLTTLFTKPAEVDEPFQGPNAKPEVEVGLDRKGAEAWLAANQWNQLNRGCNTTCQAVEILRWTE